MTVLALLLVVWSLLAFIVSSGRKWICAVRLLFRRSGARYNPQVFIFGSQVPGELSVYPL